MNINSNLKNYIESLAGAVTAMLLLVGCASDSVDTPTDNGKEKKEAIAFDTYVPYTTPTSRATYPSDTSIGDITDSRLKTVTFGVFAQSTYNTAWSGYTKSTPFNFMWRYCKSVWSLNDSLDSKEGMSLFFSPGLPNSKRPSAVS